MYLTYFKKNVVKFSKNISPQILSWNFPTPNVSERLACVAKYRDEGTFFDVAGRRAIVMSHASLIRRISWWCRIMKWQILLIILMHSLRVTMTKNIITWRMLKRTRLLRQLRLARASPLRTHAALLMLLGNMAYALINLRENASNVLPPLSVYVLEVCRVRTGCCCRWKPVISREWHEK